MKGELNKRKMVLAIIYVFEEIFPNPCPFSPCPEVDQFSSSPYVPCTFQISTPVLDLRVSEFVRT